MLKYGFATRLMLQYGLQSSDGSLGAAEAHVLLEGNVKGAGFCFVLERCPRVNIDEQHTARVIGKFYRKRIASFGLLSFSVRRLDTWKHMSLQVTPTAMSRIQILHVCLLAAQPSSHVSAGTVLS